MPGRDLPEAAPDLSPQQAQALQLECTSLFRSFLDAVMQDFFQRAAERLGEAGQDEPSFLERSRYEYGAQELVQRRSRIEDDFFNAIRDRIQDIGPVTDASCGTPSANKLALVDEAEFEDWLNLSAVVKQVETDVASQLDEFEQRYSRLVGLPIDRKNNPFGPEMIGRTFQVAIQVLDFSNPMRTVLYRTLGQAVSSHAPALYLQLNQTLVSLQPAAALSRPRQARAKAKPATGRTHPSAGPMKSGKPKPDLADIADTLNTLYKQDQTGFQTPESAEYSLDRILASLNQSQRRTASARVCFQDRLRSSEWFALATGCRAARGAGRGEPTATDGPAIGQSRCSRDRGLPARREATWQRCQKPACVTCCSPWTACRWRARRPPACRHWPSRSMRASLQPAGLSALLR